MTTQFSNVIPFPDLKHRGLRAAGRVAPAGQAMIDAFGSTATYSNGALVPGSVRDSEHSPASDSFFDASSAVPQAGGGSTPSSGGTGFNINVALPQISSLIGEAGRDILAVYTSGNAVERQRLLDQTNLQITQLNNQAAEATRAGNAAQAAAARASAAQLQMFSAQMQQQQSSNTTMYVAIAAAVALAAIGAYVVTRPSGGGSRRRSSARSNPSRGKRRKSRKARRHARR